MIRISRVKPFKERQNLRLGNFRALRHELSIVYKSCQRGDLPWPDGRAATAILLAMASLDGHVSFEARLEALERAVGAQARPNGHDGYGDRHGYA
jgi:hypothetical protein